MSFGFSFDDIDYTETTQGFFYVSTSTLSGSSPQTINVSPPAGAIAVAFATTGYYGYYTQSGNSFTFYPETNSSTGSVYPMGGKVSFYYTQPPASPAAYGMEVYGSNGNVFISSQAGVNMLYLGYLTVPASGGPSSLYAGYTYQSIPAAWLAYSGLICAMEPPVAEDAAAGAWQAGATVMIMPYGGPTGALTLQAWRGRYTPAFKVHFFANRASNYAGTGSGFAMFNAAGTPIVSSADIIYRDIYGKANTTFGSFYQHPGTGTGIVNVPTAKRTLYTYPTGRVPMLFCGGVSFPSTLYMYTEVVDPPWVDWVGEHSGVMGFWRNSANQLRTGYIGWFQDYSAVSNALGRVESQTADNATVRLGKLISNLNNFSGNYLDFRMSDTRGIP